MNYESALRTWDIMVSTIWRKQLQCIEEQSFPRHSSAPTNHQYSLTWECYFSIGTNSLGLWRTSTLSLDNSPKHSLLFRVTVHTDLQSLRTLENAYLRRFERFRETRRKDINSAVEQYLKAAASVPLNDVDQPDILCDLGNSYLAQFERFGNIQDLNSAESKWTTTGSSCFYSTK